MPGGLRCQLRLPGTNIANQKAAHSGRYAAIRARSTSSRPERRAGEPLHHYDRRSILRRTPQWDRRQTGCMLGKDRQARPFALSLRPVIGQEMFVDLSLVDRHIVGRGLHAGTLPVRLARQRQGLAV